MVTGYLPPSPQEKLEQVLDWFFFKRNRILNTSKCDVAVIGEEVNGRYNDS
jgi:hypothetical protein